jgi:catechol 2,3-dioxygenase-like lactoylglutathione lyase family enzyme
VALDRETNQPGLRIELFVRDVRASAAFYVEALGFQILRHDPSGYLSIGRPGVVIGLNRADRLPDGHPVKPLPGEPAGRGVELVVAVSDVDGAYAQAVASGRSVESPLTRRSWGLTDFRLLDPDGYYVRLTSLSQPQ